MSISIFQIASVLKGGFRGNRTMSVILNDLAEATNVKRPTKHQQPIHTHDLEIALNILNKTLDYNSRQNIGQALDEASRSNFLGVVNNILDPVNKPIWKSLLKVIIIFTAAIH